MISKNIVVTVENPEEHISISFKSIIDSNKVAILGDPGAYEAEEIQKAIEEVQKFVQDREERPSIFVEAGTRLIGCGMACECSDTDVQSD